MLSELVPPPADSLMELARLVQADLRTEKVDLGVGTFRDDLGRVPVMAAVKQAESQLLRDQITKSYVGPAGDPDFALRLQEALLPGLEATHPKRISRVQTPGGTGAVRLALELVAQATPSARIWVATPTWPVHVPIIGAVGLEAMTYPHLDAEKGFDTNALKSALANTRRGDVVLLHGCCHNPTGADLTPDAWDFVSQTCLERGLVPLIDLAYPGLGDGIDHDVAGARRLLETLGFGILAISGSKAFGLYRERVGMLLSLSQHEPGSVAMGLAAAAHARNLWSNPPDHGAAVVRTILTSAQLTHLWRSELDGMRARIHTIRQELSQLSVHGRPLTILARQKGMFAMLPLSAGDVTQLRERHAVYVDISGRINVAGLNRSNFDRFAVALSSLG